MQKIKDITLNTLEVANAALLEDKARTQSTLNGAGIKTPSADTTQLVSNQAPLLCWLPILRSIKTKSRAKSFISAYNEDLETRLGEKESRKHKLKGAHSSMLQYLIEEAGVSLYYHRQETPNIPLCVNSGITLSLNRPLLSASLVVSERSVYNHLRRLSDAGLITIVNKGHFANFKVTINPDLLVISSLKADTDYQQIKLTKLRFLPTCTSEEHSNKIIRPIHNVEKSPAQTLDPTINVPAQLSQEQDKSKAMTQYTQPSNRVKNNHRAPQNEQPAKQEGSSAAEKTGIYEPQCANGSAFDREKYNQYINLIFHILKSIYSEVNIHEIEMHRFTEYLWINFFAEINSTTGLKRFIFEWNSRVTMVKRYQGTHEWQAPTPRYYFEKDGEGKARFWHTAQWFKTLIGARKVREERKKAMSDEQKLEEIYNEIALHPNFEKVMEKREWLRRYREHLVEEFERTVGDPDFLKHR